MKAMVEPQVLNHQVPKTQNWQKPSMTWPQSNSKASLQNNIPRSYLGSIRMCRSIWKWPLILPELWWWLTTCRVISLLQTDWLQNNVSNSPPQSFWIINGDHQTKIKDTKYYSLCVHRNYWTAWWRLLSEFLDLMSPPLVRSLHSICNSKSMTLIQSFILITCTENIRYSIR